MSRQRNIDIKRELDKQMQEKLKLKELELENNAHYIKMVITQDD